MSASQDQAASAIARLVRDGEIAEHHESQFLDVLRHCSYWTVLNGTDAPRNLMATEKLDPYQVGRLLKQHGLMEARRNDEHIEFKRAAIGGLS